MRSPSRQFLKELHQLAAKTSRHAINPDDDEEVIVHDQVAVEMVPLTDGWVHFLSIRALDPGKGTGSKALNEVMQLVDTNKVNLVGKIIPYDTKVVSKEKLRAWYRKFGCHPINEADPDGLWIRIVNPATLSEMTNLDQKDLNKINKGLSDYDSNYLKKRNLLFLAVGGLLLWMSTK